MDYEIETYKYIDWSSLKSDIRASAIKDSKWVERYLDNLPIKTVMRRILPPVGKGKNSSGAPATWIDRYFRNIRFRLGHDGSLRKPIYPRSEIKEPSIYLHSSLKMFFQEASFDADEWTDVNRKYNDRRSFPAFLYLIKRSGLENYASNVVDDDINIRYPQLSYEGSSDLVVAKKYYDGSLSLIRLLERIRSVSGDDFRREQARLLGSFLNHLIKIQQEQRFVAESFSEHLERLRKFDAVSISSNAVDNGDEHILARHVWQQQHLFDSLYIMSRESAWLLKQLKDSPFTSPSTIEESNKVLDIIMVYISKFRKSKELLDRCLLRSVYDHSNGSLFELIAPNNDVLENFGGCIKNLQEQGVERNSVAKTLLGCFEDVVNMYYKLSELGNPFEGTCSSLQCSFSEAVKETSEMINEAVEKLNSIRCFDLTGGGSPLGCIALWRILFESSLIDLRLDLIHKNYDKTVKLGVKLFGTATNDQLDQIRLSINQLLTVGESVLVEFIAMHKAVAEVSYMLGDAFTTGGAGMRGLSDVTHPCKHDEQLMNFNPEDFPWDKHNVRSPTIGPNRGNWPKGYEDYE